MKPNWWLATEERRRGITRRQSPMRACPSPYPPADTAAGLCLLPGCSTGSLQRPACHIRHVCVTLCLPAPVSLILGDPNCLHPSVLLLPSPFILSLSFLLCCFPTLCLSPCLSCFFFSPVIKLLSFTWDAVSFPPPLFSLWHSSMVSSLNLPLPVLQGGINHVLHK